MARPVGPRKATKAEIEAAEKTRRRGAVDYLSPHQFYHGTNAKLKAGDALRPASELGAGYEGRSGGSEEHQAKVHVAHDPESARHFAEDAAYHHGGFPYVYQVQTRSAGEPNDISWLRGRGDRRVPRASMHDEAHVVRRVNNEDWHTSSSWRQEVRDRKSWGD